MNNAINNGMYGHTTGSLKTRPIRSMFPESMSMPTELGGPPGGGGVGGGGRAQHHPPPSQQQQREASEKVLALARARAKEVSEAKDRQGRCVTLQDRSHDFYTKFAEREVRLGPLLGKGGFCSVYEVEEFVNMVDGKRQPLGSGGGGGGGGNTVKSNNSNKNNIPTTNKNNIDSKVNTPLGPDSTYTSRESDYDHEEVGSGVPIQEQKQEQNQQVQNQQHQVQQVQAAGRVFLAEHCRRNKTGEARYAIKKISPSTTRDPSLFVQAMVDMATEARLLSALDPHPNIIKLRAVSADDEGNGPFDERYFLVLDRLYETLEERTHTWKRRDKRDAMLGWMMMAGCGAVRAGTRRRRRLDRRGQQLKSAADLAGALAHLHRRRVLHRDLKPQNVGYNIRDDLTLFDFGLARELPPLPPADGDGGDGLYRMTGFCGSFRYMAPEVGKKERYNEKCDVYSFAILCWEILSLQKSYSGHSLETLQTKVWDGPQLRPNTIGSPKGGGKNKSNNTASAEGGFNSSTSNDGNVIMSDIRIEVMLERAWDKDVASRPTMEEVVEMLREECLANEEDRNAKGGGEGRRRAKDVDGGSIDKASSDDSEGAISPATVRRRSSHRWLSRRSTHVFEPLAVIHE